VPDLADFPNDFQGYNRAVIREFREHHGKVTGMFAGAPLVVLTTTGAKSGQPRETPVVHTQDEHGNVVVIASKGGAPTHPDWFRNMQANPKVVVELPDEKYEARARVATGDERRRLYDAQAALMPTFNEYQQKTDREIPVVVLERT
jgi:deazaflavin-dependent oxidoreductase (nitroreductase family)